MWSVERSAFGFSRSVGRSCVRGVMSIKPLPNASPVKGAAPPLAVGVGGGGGLRPSTALGTAPAASTQSYSSHSQTASGSVSGSASGSSGLGQLNSSGAGGMSTGSLSSSTASLKSLGAINGSNTTSGGVTIGSSGTNSAHGSLSSEKDNHKSSGIGGSPNGTSGSATAAAGGSSGAGSGGSRNPSAAVSGGATASTANATATGIPPSSAGGTGGTATGTGTGPGGGGGGDGLRLINDIIPSDVRELREHFASITPRLTVKHFALAATLGTGTFGRVRLVNYQYQSRQHFFALKMLKKTEIIRLKQVDHIKAEKAILCRITHPFIVNLYAHFQDERSLFMVMEYVIGGELFSQLRKVGRFHNDVGRFYAAEIVLALEYLHDRVCITHHLLWSSVWFGALT